jgi:glutathione S-transferase
MNIVPKLTLFHSPNTRSTGVRVLLEELKAPYELRAVNMKVGEQLKPEFKAINPLGKVPTVTYGDTVVTEQPAIYIFLADLFPAARLAPGLTDTARGSYLRWMVYYGSCLEPAMVDKALKREPGDHGLSPYGTYDEMINALAQQLARGPYMLGETFSAADVLWGSALGWMIGFKLVPDTAVFKNYVERVTSRPAFKTVMDLDTKMAAEHQAAAAKLKAWRLEKTNRLWRPTYQRQRA